MKTMIKILLVGVLLFGNHSAFTQFGTNYNDAKEKVYNSKVKKSPASEEIIKVDKALTELDRYKDKSARYVYLDNGHYKTFTKNYELAAELIPIIKEKDPKWKIEKQESAFAPFNVVYEEAITLQKDYEALEEAFKANDKYFSDKAYLLISKWKACGYSNSGNMDLDVEARRKGVNQFKKFIFGTNEKDLQWEELKSKIPVAQDVLERYKKEYEAKGGMARDIYSNGLRVFTENGFESPAWCKGKFISYCSKNRSNYEGTPNFEDLPDYLIKSKFDKIATECLLNLFPGDKELTKILETINSFRLGLQTTFKEEIALSNFHSEIIEGVYFSDHPVKIGAETKADFKTEFKSTDAIYMTVYYSEKYNMCSKSVEVIDRNIGERINLRYFPYGIKNGCIEMTSAVQVTLIPSSFEEGKPIYHSVIDLLGHLMKIQKKDKLSFEVGKTDISIDFSQGTAKYTDLYDQLIKHRRRTLSPPKAKMSVSLSLKKACEEEGFNETLVKIIPVASDWDYDKNSYGIILSRELDAVLLFKDTNGKCFMRDVTIYQEKTGSGYASPTISGVSNFYQQEVTQDEVILHKAQNDDYRVYCNCQ